MTNYITTEQFKKKLEELGFDAEIDHNNFILIYPTINGETKRHGHVGSVSLDEVNSFSVGCCGYGIVATDELSHLCWQYASTPLSEREPEKKYHLKLRMSEKLNDFYLRKYVTISDMDMYDCATFESTATVFTDTEIQQLHEQGIICLGGEPNGVDIFVKESVDD